VPDVLPDIDREFLARPRLGFLTVAPASRAGWPAPRPVWFEHTPAGDVQLFSFARSPKVARVRATPRASLLVANEVGEPEHWILFVGSAAVHADGAVDLAERLAERYWDLGDPVRAAALQEFQASELVRIVITPEKVTRYGG
jgi:general stress protein 26